MSTPDNNTEVNNNSSDDDEKEVYTLEDLENPEDDSVVDGAVEEDPQNRKDEEEEKETPSESSEDDKPAEDEEESDEDESETEGDESSDEVTDEKKEPKEVPGETPKERALRMEVTRLKRLRREERGQKMFKEVPTSGSSEDLSEDEKVIYESFDPEQRENMEKLIAISAKKMGFVKKDEFSKETYQSKAQGLLDDFLENHPEYDETNDPDGVLWKRFGQEYSMYKLPTNPNDLNKIFKRIHKDIFGIETDSKDLKSIEAKQEKIKSVSHGATSKGGGKPNIQKSSKKVDPELQELVNSGALKGYTKEELKELGFDA